jgi:hypothetical protein
MMAVSIFMMYSCFSERSFPGIARKPKEPENSGRFLQKCVEHQSCHAVERLFIQGLTGDWSAARLPPHSFGSRGKTVRTNAVPFVGDRGSDSRRRWRPAGKRRFGGATAKTGLFTSPASMDTFASAARWYLIRSLRLLLLGFATRTSIYVRLKNTLKAYMLDT